MIPGYVPGIKGPKKKRVWPGRTSIFSIPARNRGLPSLTQYWTPRERWPGLSAVISSWLQLSHFLQSLKIGKNGLAFIMNEKQELVAYPDPAQLIVDPGETGLLRPFRVDAMDNPALVAAFQEYLKTGQAEFAFKKRGARYRASFTDISRLFWKTMESGGGCPRK